MCSINGFNFSDESLVHEMNKVTKHRGPDDTGSFLYKEWSLGHNRLSILDLTDKGHQPMETPDGRYIVIFNGEIYNFKELREELKGCGHVFRGNSDTEVLLYAFCQWGKDCLSRLNGMFAFAILDKEANELFLARDRIGIKPLYYYIDKGKFIFSSEAKAIFVHNVPRILNVDSFNMYLRFLYTPSPLTMWEHIYKLPPAHYMTVQNGEIKIERYWKLGGAPLMHDRRAIEQELKALMFDSVKKRLVSERPVGIFLSGGIDSTIIAGLASELHPSINTFSVGFEQTEEAEKYNNDARIARQTAKYFNTNHHEFTVSAQDIKENIERTIYHMDEPISNHVQTVNLLLAEQTVKSSTVVLGGDGGDELFGGYERYYYNALIDKVQHIPRMLRDNTPVRGFCARLGKAAWYKKMNSKPGTDRYMQFFAQKEAWIESFLSSKYNRPDTTPRFFQERYFEHVEKPFTGQFMRTDVQSWLPDESLVRSDRMSMASGLEQRVPFLDHRIVEFAERIPVSYKLGKKGSRFLRVGHDYEGKQILRTAMSKYLPSFVLKEPKWGWFSPAAKWIRGPLHPIMQEVLSESYCKETSDMFDFVRLQKMFEDHNTKKHYALNTLWCVMTFQMWYRQHMKR